MTDTATREIAMAIALHGERGRGLSVIVDIEDLDRFQARRWYLAKNGYVVANDYVNRKHRTIYLHQLVCQVPAGQKVDHKDGVRLDCRRSNLRPATHAQNNRNTGRRGHSRQPYKGVRAWKCGSFSARIRVDRREIYLGTYPTAEHAARAYDAAARDHFGDFARPNFLEVS